MSDRSFAVIAVLMVAGGSAIALTETHALANPLQPMPVLFAQNQPRSHPNWLKELNLNPEQIRKIEAIRSQYQARLSEQREAVRQAQQGLKQLMASSASSEQIRQKFEQLQSLKQKLGETRMESMLAIRNVLNPEQRQKLNEIIKRRHGQPGRDRSES